MGACCAKRSAPGARAGPNAEVQVRPNFDSPLPRTLREEVVISREIDVDVERTQQQASRVKKLLLLGAGESGKSTLYRQMKRIYGVGFSKQEMEDYKRTIMMNVAEFLLTVIRAAVRLEPEIGMTLSPARLPLRDELALHAANEADYTARTAELIAELWNDPALKAAFELRSHYQVPDCAQYFFERAAALAEPTYTPTDTDILMSRIRTTGILETRFKISGTVFDIFDVGGQRNERKKWIHCFENVTAVIFVIALSEYDQVLFEDENVNRMTEALELFEETVNSKWFTKVDIIVFLNKMDLLAKKVAKVPISDYFPQYTGGANVAAASQFFMELVIARNRTPSRGIYCHMTNATDEANVIHVFSAVRDIVLRKGMAGTGLL
ncbi:unnamed protein product (mitochondrion) [Plasmodiophora brassicae]|uniref:Uncharacterized protein n=1 Tax=Plasmodiophora brassicae TaxID=37360 RepID=A0A0G4IU92_PLABS|nr:hypothetical protein PBRA_006770 [Plasmodiophora brassicae]SPR00794.1 unnamed protein product [Plasmodiophora brassicae]